VGALQAGAARGADRLSTAGVLVFGRDVAQTLVKPDRVVERLDAVELGLQLTGVGDLFEVRVLGLDVAEQRLDPGLVVGLTG
jgi:hypothetical protein